MTSTLPPGFVLDPMPNANAARLPPGFVLDDIPAQSQQPNIAHKGDMAPGDRVPADLHATTTQGITIGAGDEAAAGLRAAQDSLLNRISGEGPTSLKENYDQAKAYLDAQLAATYEQHPIAGPVTEFAGAVMAPGGVGAKAAVRAPTLLSKIGRGPVTGAGYGGVYGFNSGDSLSDRLQKAQEGARVGAFVGGTVPVAGTVLGKGYRAFTNAFGGPRAAETLQAFSRAGVRPTAGAVTASRPVQMIEQALANTPGSAGRMQSAWAQQTDDFAREAERVANQAGSPRTQQGAGEVIRDASKAATERFEKRQEELYDRAYRYIGPQTSTATPHTQQLLGELINESWAARGARDDVLKPIIEKARSIVNAQGMPFEDFRRLRTDIGRMLKVRPQGMSESAQQDKLRALYGALTRDMQEAARQAGPHAERALKVADRYTRFNLTANQKLWQKLENTQADEKAFQFAMEGSQRGGSRLWALRKNFTNDEWDTVAATVIDQMGKAPAHLRGTAELGGAAHDFSASTFLTNWNKLSPEAKVALFSGRRYTELRRSLDNLMEAMNAAKNTQRMSNPSGTARQLLTAGQGAAAATAAFTGNIPTAVAILAGPWISGRMMTSPTFIRLLTGFAKTADKGPQAIQRFATNLGFAASAEPDIREEILQLQRQLLSHKALEPAA